MKQLVLILIILPSLALAETRVYFEDFESSSWTDSFQSTGLVNVARTTNTPYAGTYCMRGNLNAAVVPDPIESSIDGTGNPQIEFRGGGSILSTANQTIGGQVFIRYWRRFDEATWAGIELDAGRGKSEYLIDFEDGADHAVFFINLPVCGTCFRFATNNLSLYHNWADINWGYTRAYLGSPSAEYGLSGSYTHTEAAADGLWHKIEYLIDYDSDFIEFWVDDVHLDGQGGYYQTYYPLGQVPIPSFFDCKGIQFLYTSSSYVADSQNGGAGNYHCGWQIDNIEVWDGYNEDSGQGDPGDPQIAPCDSVWAEAGGG